jgi:hypothetical protein
VPSVRRASKKYVWIGILSRKMSKRVDCAKKDLTYVLEVMFLMRVSTKPNRV